MSVNCVRNMRGAEAAGEDKFIERILTLVKEGKSVPKKLRIDFTSLNPEKKRFFQSAILSWWRKNKTDYPWRSYSDPWRVLLAEILLRKTNAEKAARFIGKIVETFPSPKSILIFDGRLDELIKPFGMHKKKSAELLDLAKILCEKHGGQVPSSLDELETLPGVGGYVANAVLCFGFGLRRPVVDVNVIRVFEHVFGFLSSRSRPRTDPEVWRFAEELLPESDCREFNWALLDLGKKLKRKKGKGKIE